MEILVCVKQVPDTAEIKVDSGTNTVDASGAPKILNPFDANAVEAAVQLKEEHGGNVTVLSMGTEQTKAVLKACISVGADKAVLLNDDLFKDSDTFATSYILASAIKKLGSFDLILCGKQAIDGDSGQVGPQIAEHLGVAQITYASKIQYKDNRLVVNREHEDGYEIIMAKLPAVCIVVNTINTPRYATVKSKMAANKAKIVVLAAADLPELDQTMIGLEGSPTKTIEVFTPPKKASGIKIKEGTGNESGIKLAKMLISERVI
ncbi:electron transfer flavoprotein subunit beta/FixA family protein [Desulfitobacterium sp. Sab5]|uniref:electron transfer flavoprotein subunit beta/FixA family protein n=1 Tax=Desulfitobacterium nosdiversum TaxID=3375356 RepID=UPI003CEB0485